MNIPDSLSLRPIGIPAVSYLVILTLPFMLLLKQRKFQKKNFFSIYDIFRCDTLTDLTLILSLSITVFFWGLSSVSFQKLYVNITKELVYPQLTAIIDVEMGDVVGISWDDGCIFCGSSECDENTFNFQGESSTPIDDAGSCGETVDFCRDSLARESGECDLMLYVVWTGTDSNGRAFKSAAYRFSAFPKQELGDNFDISLPQIDWPDNPFT